MSALCREKKKADHTLHDHTPRPLWRGSSSPNSARLAKQNLGKLVSKHHRSADEVHHWPRISSYCSPVRLHKSWPPRSRIVKSLAVAAATTPNSLPQAKMASMTRSASSAGLCWLSGSNTRPIVRLHKRRRHIVVFF